MAPEGAYLMTPPRARSASTRPRRDDTTDAYDTIDWLVKNVPESNGTRRHDRIML